MKANELRIGNLVDLGNRIAKVIDIGHNSCTVVDLEETQDTLESYERTKGIVLTEEWLFKCAFIKLDDLDEVYYILGNNEFYIKIEDKVFWIYFDEQPNHPITCVFNLHQLQNLYFSLTSNELNITL